jgi:hypothetical protein
MHRLVYSFTLQQLFYSLIHQFFFFFVAPWVGIWFGVSAGNWLCLMRGVATTDENQALMQKKVGASRGIVSLSFSCNNGT